jgi:hypothetical protein
MWEMSLSASLSCGLGVNVGVVSLTALGETGAVPVRAFWTPLHW